MLTSSLRCRAKVFTVAYQSLYNVVLLLLCCHILFSILLTCSSCTNFFLYLEYTRQAHILGPFHLLLSLPKTSCRQIFTWLTPLLVSGLLLKCHLFSETFPVLFKITNSRTTFSDLFSIAYAWTIYTLYVIIYFSNHFVSSFSPSKYQIHQDRDFHLVHCNIPHLPQCLAHERHSTGVLSSE